MAARIRLAKNASATQASIRIRLADPPFDFVVTGTWTGTILIEASEDSMLIDDATTTWRTLLTFTTNGDQNWNSPLFRIRANLSGVATGSATVDMLEGIRSVKNEWRGNKNRKPTAQQARKAVS